MILFPIPKDIGFINFYSTISKILSIFVEEKQIKNRTNVLCIICIVHLESIVKIRPLLMCIIFVHFRIDYMDKIYETSVMSKTHLDMVKIYH